MPAERIVVISHDEMRRRVALGDSTYLAIFVEADADEHRIVIAGDASGPHLRTVDAVAYLQAILAAGRGAGIGLAAGASVFVQGGDRPSRDAGISWQGRRDWQIGLIPDLYFYQEQGYAGFGGSVMPWAVREPKLFWRGSTTGLERLTLDQLPTLPRYRAAVVAAGLGARFDVGFTGVVQACAPVDHAEIEERLRAEGLARRYFPLQRMDRFKLLLEIDGNASPWGTMARLRLGCCLLRVDSDWTQWFTAELTPWHHYVPVRGDLGDLADKVDWCLANDAETSRIAEEGRAFARAMSLNGEMTKAARALSGT